MHIVIHAGGIPFNGDTIKKQSLGGSESAAYYTAKELANRGHHVVVFTETDEPGETDGVIYVNMGARTNEHPMGENWHFYCEHTPHEVNIVQRQPGAFMFHIQSKINLWWAHDIAMKRNNGPFMAQLWQTDRVLPVSKWFKDQIASTWTCNPDCITPIHNGVDYSLFEKMTLKDNSEEEPNKPITLLYSSRPERGLENLVKPGGIMEQLLEKAPHIKLKVCGYEHPVPNLDGFYKALRDRCEELPNVEHLGTLTKEELARVQCEEADVWCYPTEFEEVSCITAMEAMAAGMYILTTNTAALPETIGLAYENQTRYNYDDQIVDRFVEFLSGFDNQFRRRPLRHYTWDSVADEFEAVIEDCFKKYTSDTDAMARHFLHTSDIEAIKHLPQKGVPGSVLMEIDELYSQWREDPAAYAKHYAGGTEQMYDSPDFKYETEEFMNHPRFVAIAKHIKETIIDGAVVIDYGCAHGMFINYLAKVFPNIDFVGIDVSPAAIKKAEEKRDEMGLSNSRFVVEDWLASDYVHDSHWNCNLIIIGEVLEHVPDPVKFMDVVKGTVGEASVIMSTPIGPWEAISYEHDYPERYHLHHFERGDLEDLFSHHPDFVINCMAATHTPRGEILGWYVTKFTLSGSEAAKPINYSRKIAQTKTRQTVSLCMIAKNADTDIARMLKSVEPYVDEILIGVDESTDDSTIKVLQTFKESCEARHRSPRLFIDWFKIPSPIEIGFDEARNLVLKKATKHWVMWADADEVLVNGERLVKYLRQNCWNGYGTPQHHFSTEPLGVLSTDYPVRLFRRNDDVRFRGVVHEHPENVNKPDDGVGFAYVLHEIQFSHFGYSTEGVRRKRFMRNIDLMVRDREKHPDRLLGKFLWIRDLALMCRFDLEQTQGQVTQEMQKRAIQGLQLWEDTIDNCSHHPQVRRMVKDHLEFYDTLVKVIGQGFAFSINLASSSNAQAPLDPNAVCSAQFLNRRHLDKFLSVIIDEEVKDYGTKYH